ncbi:ligase-associated DNA damage response endonuclease PdeM [Paracoccus shanxieyensis]|uniref:Ligase-associated DNA damage response endonuclease PdeM n=1 Tax=Paracoccus shanxieyensis TaxID=2675752 RepID=A0A6L6IT30_9RHOB|nr:ligase-associated DNA damage response endonuclease PdeM [Paracoccus shanxieyensis]MTH62761.1 ligase-associated DNA damage response endonuclease PdeM [Paracoccus shanxieyensis]MTH86155.1 ligase-associated DNA damage response endonuclease PdeM [Paracoccus shanxieyensis]
MSYGFDFHGLRLEARGSGALWWPEGRWLIVADLHFGKSERMARRGGSLLPPYEGQATLDRLEAEIAELHPTTIISLGDGFDDLAAVQALDGMVAARLVALARHCDWVWIGGNHDPGAPLGMPGRALDSLHLGPVALRHEAGQGPDISGHYHPAVRLAGERRRAFLLGAEHLILPAFGAYTGGLICDDPALVALVPRGLAIACGPRPVVMPLGIATRPRRGWR